MKKDRKHRRLVGALGGAGGALVLGTMVHYLIWPQQWSWELALSFETIGIFLNIMAVYVYLKEGKMKKDRKHRRLVGALGGAGGITFGAMLSYLTLPQAWTWGLALSFETIGLFLIIMAVFFDLKE